MKPTQSRFFRFNLLRSMLGSAALLWSGAILVFAAAGQPSATPALLLGQSDQLPRVKAELAAGNPALVAAVDKLKKTSDAALKKPVTNVVEGGDLPPSGDAHDYYSLSPYWWPDPAKADGLPYIWRDGQENPDRKKSDIARLDAMIDAVTAEVPAWYFTGDVRYAENAVQRLRT